MGKKSAILYQKVYLNVLNEKWEIPKIPRMEVGLCSAKIKISVLGNQLIQMNRGHNQTIVEVPRNILITTKKR